MILNFLFLCLKKKKLEKNKILKKIFFKFIIFFENLILRLTKKNADHLSKFDIKKIVKKQIRVKVLKTNKLDKGLLRNIKNEKFDILIRSCSNVLSNDFFKISKFGVISFHHGDYTKFRGSPAGFWEVLNQEKNTGFMIQIINKGLDYGNIILEGFVQTKSFFLLNQSELYKKSNVYLKKILLDFSKNKKFFFIKKRKKGKIYETPKLYNQIKYVCQTIKLLIKKIFLDKYNFNLALFKLNNNSAPLIIKSDKKKFLADPFLIKDNKKTYCFAEEYDHVKKRGHIVCINLNKKELDQYL